MLNANSTGYYAYEYKHGGALIQSFNTVWTDNSHALDFDDMCRGINVNLEKICAASGRSQVMERIGLGLTKRIVFVRPGGKAGARGKGAGKKNQTTTGAGQVSPNQPAKAEAAKAKADEKK